MTHGPWMQTYLQNKFHPFSPVLDEIHIEDIAHSLSNICRFNGHCKKFYSVAEHSVYVSCFVPPGFELEGLLDDAAEAYIGDMIRPVKYELPDYQLIDDKLSETIRRKFGLPEDRSQEVIKIDNAVLYDESIQCMGGQVEDWCLPEKPTGVKIEFWLPEQAEIFFIDRYWELATKHLSGSQFNL
jgi:uncharacterized protein